VDRRYLSERFAGDVATARVEGADGGVVVVGAGGGSGGTAYSNAL
jgi:hypothetical protein